MKYFMHIMRNIFRNRGNIKYKDMRIQPVLLGKSSREHAYIVSTTLNPTFI